MEKQFNKPQKEAVEWGNGPCLVLAGPGSGKTFVLTHRLLNLISRGFAEPENILVITFTRASANEMKERFIKLLNDENLSTKKIPLFGTFHSIFFEILKESFAYTSDSVIEAVDEKRIIAKVLEKEKDLNVTSDTIDNFLKDMKNYKLSIERGEIFTPKYISSRLFNKTYLLYEEALFNEKKLDFFDMIDKCKELLMEHDDILSIYNEKFKYILIDEFQDINKSQYDLVKLLCKNRNLFVVGDDDQSIYRFRGSHPRVMKDFLKDYKNAKIINLNTNYRCARVIVKFSRLVIEHNRERFDKKLVAKRDEIGKLHIKAFVDSEEENKYIIEKITEYRRKGIELRDMAILYRTNLLSNVVKSALIKHNIKYNVKGENINIYENFAIKDILSYLRLAINKYDTQALINIANKPLRYISRDSIGYKNTSVDNLIEYYKNKEFMLKYITKFKHNLYTINKLITPLAIRYIRSEVGYDEYIKKYCISKNIDYEEIEYILDSFEEESIGHNDILEFLNYIIEVSKKEKENLVADEDAIKLMTFHLSKGLEYKVVFIIDANDGLIPHKKSIKENDIETERRLFYVGMTRAKDFLHVLFTTRRFGKNFEPSRFIIEAVGGQNGNEK